MGSHCPRATLDLSLDVYSGIGAGTATTSDEAAVRLRGAPSCGMRRQVANTPSPTFGATYLANRCIDSITVINSPPLQAWGPRINRVGRAARRC
jgi:hypothetical protein